VQVNYLLLKVPDGRNFYTMLDEMERALHDTLSIIKRTLESGAVVPGGGAVESALSIYLENFATTLVRIPYVVLISIANHCDTLGFEGTTSHRGVCQCLALHPQDSRRQRR
jgi:hypothetical protein